MIFLTADSRRSNRGATAFGAVLLALVAGLSGAAPAVGSEPIWRPGGDVRALLFDAGHNLILGDAGAARTSAERARATYERELAPRLRRAAPAADRAVHRALSKAERAAAAGDEPSLAAARGDARAALFRGSYVAALAAAHDGRAEAAQDWLRLREFRTATRFSRPGSEATVVLGKLAEGTATASEAALAVEKDLLDAYQARLREILDESADAAENGFDVRVAERTALAAGYWQILSPRLAEERGADGADAADRTFADLREARGAALEPALDRAREIVDGFTAAPFTPEEQARRATQFIRFLDLVPLEYDDGTSDGRVTIDFEIQEAIAFRDAAESALADLQAPLSERAPEQLALIKQGLGELKPLVEEAGRRTRIVEQNVVDDTYERTRAAVDVSFPKEWTDVGNEADFDLIALTLDRVEAAMAAGEYEQAEQARLESYAFFEFGPELYLRSLAPEIVAEVEWLVWFGYRENEGLATQIAEHAPIREVQQTREALDETLERAGAALGRGSTTASVVTNSALIVFREGLEAVLILAALMAAMRGAAERRQRRPIWLGVGLALFATAITFVLAQTVLGSLAQYGEKLEAIVGLIAVAVLLVVLNWFLHRIYWTQHISRFTRQRRKLAKMGAGGLVSVQVLGFVMLGFATVYREGFETVLFLQALQLSSGTLAVLEGVALGMAGVIAVGVTTFKLERKLPYKRLLIVTGILIGLVLVVMVGKTVRTMQGVGWMPITPIDVEFPYWAALWFGLFPTVEAIAAQIFAAAFVIGSYFAAERMRKRGPRAARRPDNVASGDERGGTPVRA